MIDWEFLVAIMTYGNVWRARRKLFQKHFNPAKPGVHRPLALKATRERLLPQLLSSPESWVEICRQYVTPFSTLHVVSLTRESGVLARLARMSSPWHTELKLRLKMTHS